MPRSTVTKTLRIKPELWAHVESAAGARMISPNGWLTFMIELHRDKRLTVLKKPKPQWATASEEKAWAERKADWREQMLAILHDTQLSEAARFAALERVMAEFGMPTPKTRSSRQLVPEAQVGPDAAAEGQDERVPVVG